MRQKKAKQLRRLASLYCKEQDIPIGKGYNKYQQAQNCHALAPMLNKDGTPMRDETGKNLLKPVRHPGTIFHAWEWKAIYRRFKAMYKDHQLVIPEGVR